jgi:V/A-type H+/Na+-transporting ATPase subunit C
LSSRTYVGTRAFALKGTLLDHSAIEKLAESTSLDELANRLRATPYADPVSRLTPPLTARRIELALRERLARVHSSLMASAGKYRLLQLYYNKYVAWDLKSALKSKALGMPMEEAEQFVDMKAEELVGRRDLMVKVLSARDVQEAVSLLSGSEFHDDVEKALAAFSARGEVRFFDIYIDHAVLTGISRTFSRDEKTYASKSLEAGSVGAIVAADVDAYNALGVLRAKLWGLPEAEVSQLVISPTYKVPSALLARMAASESIETAVKMMEQVLPVSVPGEQTDAALVDAVEAAFVRRMRNTISRSFLWQGIGPANALALVKLLEFEVGNLSAVAIGVEAHLPSADILRRLVS